MKQSFLALCTLVSLLSSGFIFAETRYITDEFKITLRTGPSTSNSILKMLNSGEAIKFIENDAKTKYTLVETSNGKQGYVLSRFLDAKPSGRELYLKLQVKSQKQQKMIKALKQDLKKIKQDKNNANSEIIALSTQLSDTTESYDQLKFSTKDTFAVIEENNDQQALIQTLQAEKESLLTENNGYKDSTAMDWFIRGSGVSLLAFLIGIIVTRVKWTKRDSWGEY